MKYLVETRGEYELFDLFGRQTVSAYRPSVVRHTPFIDNMKGLKLNVIEILADDAEDTALAAAANPEDLAKAIAALPRPTVEATKGTAAAPAPARAAKVTPAAKK